MSKRKNLYLRKKHRYVHSERFHHITGVNLRPVSADLHYLNVPRNFLNEPSKEVNAANCSLHILSLHRKLQNSIKMSDLKPKPFPLDV